MHSWYRFLFHSLFLARRATPLGRLATFLFHLVFEIHRLRREPRIALARIHEAEQFIKPGNAGLGVAELQIVKGEAQVEAGERAEGEVTLLSALETSSAQAARTFALRAALSLARAGGSEAEADPLLAWRLASRLPSGPAKRQGGGSSGRGRL